MGRFSQALRMAVGLAAVSAIAYLFILALTLLAAGAGYPLGWRRVAAASFLVLVARWFLKYVLWLERQIVD